MRCAILVGHFYATGLLSDDLPARHLLLPLALAEDDAPSGRTRYVRVSLHTRSPRQAQSMSLALVLAGQSALRSASLAAMTYEQMLNHVQSHFALALANFKTRRQATGPLSGNTLEGFRATQRFMDEGAEAWLELGGDEGGEALLRDFLSKREIVEDLPPQERKALVEEIHNGNRSFLAAALTHNASLQSYELEQRRHDAPVAEAPPAPIEEPVETYSTTVATYLAEGQRGNQWVAKTLSEKRDALDLLGAITGEAPVSTLTKADARKAKATVLKLPKNRSKDSAVRGLSLQRMLDDTTVPKIAPRTVNAYLSAFQSFTAWAVNNGYADENVFAGGRVTTKTRGMDGKRDAFSGQQLALLFQHLTANPDGLVKKEDHKWPVLIAMFTGARLNEVAQLQVSDVQDKGGIWCFDLNEADGKKLKNNASARLVPVHSKLLALGLLDFVERRRTKGHARLFPSLTYTTQNGYGRNVGRWFNEKLLPKLSMKQGGLVFHSLRHSMITRLSQADVPDSMVKAIVGHEQVGVTHTSYFKSGFTTEQLKREIDKFTF